MDKIVKQTISEQIKRIEAQITELQSCSPSKAMETEFRRIFGLDWKKQQPELLEKFNKQQNIEITAIATWKLEINQLRHKIRDG